MNIYFIINSFLKKVLKKVKKNSPPPFAFLRFCVLRLRFALFYDNKTHI